MLSRVAHALTYCNIYNKYENSNSNVTETRSQHLYGVYARIETNIILYRFALVQRGLVLRTFYANGDRARRNLYRFQFNANFEGACGDRVGGG